MADNSISIGTDAKGNIIQGSSVQGSVSNTMNEMPASTDLKTAEINTLIQQLKTTIEAEPGLDVKSKERALKYVKKLGEAASNYKDKDMKDQAEDAITLLEKILSGLKSGASLLTSISQLFSIG
ncbi:hypothetical protein HW132_18160 [Brasilonema sp. CT11]|nr:hypothetical protein [Brasilonema sp. CT11]